MLPAMSNFFSESAPIVIVKVVEVLKGGGVLGNKSPLVQEC